MVLLTLIECGDLGTNCMKSSPTYGGSPTRIVRGKYYYNLGFCVRDYGSPKKNLREALGYRWADPGLGEQVLL